MTVDGDTGPAPLPLAGYVAELMSRLAAGDTAAFDRLRAIVGSSRARIRLEDSTIEVQFAPGGKLIVVDADASADAGDGRLDGDGHTTHATVLGLLAGTLDVTDAILDGHIEARGTNAAVAAIFAAIDILLDSASRIPALRELADRYVAEHAAWRPTRTPVPRRTSWPPDVVDSLEHETLQVLGLPDAE